MAQIFNLGTIQPNVPINPIEAGAVIGALPHSGWRHASNLHHHVRVVAMSNRFVDGYGQVWRDVPLPGGAVRSFRDLQDHEDVSMEMKEIRAERKAARQLFWPAVALTFLLNILVLSLLIAAATWLLPQLGLAVVAVVVSVAYTSAMLLVTVHAIGARVGRMEFHALTVHNAVLSSGQPIPDSAAAVAPGRSA